MSWKTCASASSSHSEKKVDALSLEKKVKLKSKVHRLFPFQKLNPKSRPFNRFYKKCLTFLWAVVFSGEGGRLMIIMWRWFLMMWWWWWGRWIIHLSSKLPQCRQLDKRKELEIWSTSFPIPFNIIVNLKTRGGKGSGHGENIHQN